MKHFYLITKLFFLLLIPFKSIAVLNSADCVNAIVIDLSKKLEYTGISAGYGATQEILSNSKQKKYFFEQEHNTTWYKILIPYKTEVSFIIIPEFQQDDIDFLVFEYKGTDFCNDFSNQNLLPIRNNIARNKPENKGITGLKKGELQKYATLGIGNNFSKSFISEYGCEYYLIIDNINNTKGKFKLTFELHNRPLIAGIVIDKETKKPVIANCSLKDKNGNLNINTSSELPDGRFYIKSDYKTNLYQLDIVKKGYMYETYNVTEKTVFEGKALDLKIELRKLKVGESFTIRNLNFEGGTTKLINKAESSLEALYEIMIHNPAMIIRLEGHVHGESGANNSLYNSISTQRAEVVKNYLLNKGIKPERVSAIGLGTTKLLFSEPKNEAEAEKNRRVEILVISL